MSVEIVLVPLAVAAFSAWQARQTKTPDGRQFVQVGTRMRNPDLLAQALRDTQAQVSSTGEALSAVWPQGRATFTPDADGVWTAHFDEEPDSDRAVAVIRAVDAAYGRRVQQAVLTRLRERAGDAGMSIESETLEPDQTVTLILNVGRA